ncbi:MAG: phage major capsid protein, partial [Pisciglobus halotolerans]|nr:phage major capsid protein [Pisciglobus halotolerans]
MVMNLKGTGINLEKYNAKRDVFVNLVKENADKEKQDEAYINMVNAMAEDTVAAAEKSGIKAAEQKFDELSNYKNKGLNSKEVKFFNEINTETGYKEETLLPETTIDKIFDDMVQERPLLQEIGVKPNGLRMRVIKSDPKGQAVWGKIFGEIKGQLDAAFTEEEINQNKLTAFVVVPTDLEEYG